MYWLVPEGSALLELAAACTATVDIGNRSIKTLYCGPDVCDFLRE